MVPRASEEARACLLPLCERVRICASTNPPKVLPVSVFGHALRRVDLAHQGAEASSFRDVLPAAHAKHLQKHTRHMCEEDACGGVQVVFLNSKQRHTEGISSHNQRSEIKKKNWIIKVAETLRQL